MAKGREIRLRVNERRAEKKASTEGKVKMTRKVMIFQLATKVIKSKWK